jgi:aspartyl-tRNA(Asn)/glutamyl-tRNA(Gln) amidotransferase subunit C
MIDKETVKHVAKASRINLSDEEIEKFAKELDEVLGSFALLNEVDTSNTVPSFQPNEIKNVVRDDVAEESLSQDDALSNAEQKEEKFFKGPRSV